MKANYNKIINKIGISNIENNDSDKPLYFIKLNFGIELLKLIIFLFITAFFILLQYNNNFIAKSNKIDILRLVYLYTFGLAFGDLMILFLIGFYLTLILNWLSPFLKNKYFRWFFKHQKVNYLTLKKQTIIFIWLNLLVIAIIYHSVLLFYRVDLHTSIIPKNEILNVFKKGWIYSFTNENSILKTNFSKELPNASFNIGVYADTLLNLPVLLTFSPYLSWLIALFIFSFSWLKLVTIKPREYLKNLNINKSTLPDVRKYIFKNKLGFYLTNQTKNLFNLLALMASILKIEIYKTKYSVLLDEIENNFDEIVQNEEFIAFINKHNGADNDTKKPKEAKSEAKAFQKINIEPDLLISSVNPVSLLVDNTNNINEYDTKQLEFSSYTNEFNADEIQGFTNESTDLEFLYQSDTHAVTNDFDNNSLDSESILSKEPIIDKSNNPINQPNFNIDTIELELDNAKLESSQHNIINDEAKLVNDQSITDNLPESNEPYFFINTTELYIDNNDQKSYETIKLDNFRNTELSNNSSLIFEFDFENDDQKLINKTNRKNQNYSNFDNDNSWISPILSDNK
ncbi:Hypothetical protein, predicted transmembrane protein [Mycoplasmopsis agalactiae 14628]|uniref:Uncharacterized protein n=1 Tax=Mycoplasmopsis agalactiae 14628 TaxID=1110504 RepID=I5D6Y6_MYCAA|nr:hypothetical protein [Mycoplasmopsis agalactiae]EIN15445.1 Hypothetical protein, predicted transmembrane protein [Mycoplasmopsis agalactiae 14628]